MIELRKPDRNDFSSDEDWLFACGIESERYTKALFQSIDRVPSVSLDIASARRYDEQRLHGRDRTINDYLQERPELLRRYKKYGPSVLFEI
jgi:hypothetical protein